VEFIQNIANAVLEWFQCLCHPILTCQAILRADISPNEKMIKSLRIWVTAAFISLLVQVPLYSFSGIIEKDVGFYSTNELLLVLLLFLNGFMIHLGLKIYKVRSELADTFAINTVFAGCFSPLFTILLYPVNMRFLLTIQEAKHSKSSLGDIIAKAGNSSGQSFLDIASSGVITVAGCLSLFLASALITVISYHYGVSKYRAACAATLGSAVLNPIPMMILGALQAFAIYVSIP
jgi:hypothetical protein